MKRTKQTATTKARPVGRPETGHRFVGIRFLPDFLERIDKWRARNRLDRSKAIKILLEIGLDHEEKRA